MASVSLAAARRSVSRIARSAPRKRHSRSTSAALGGPMVDDRDRSAVGVADLQGRLQGVEILRVENGRQGRAIDRPVLLHRLGRDVGRVGNLLHANNTVVRHGR